MSSHRSASGRRSPGSRPSGRGFSKMHDQLDFIFGARRSRPKMVRMFEQPQAPHFETEIPQHRGSDSRACWRRCARSPRRRRHQAGPRLMSSRPSSLFADARLAVIRRKAEHVHENAAALGALASPCKIARQDCRITRAAGQRRGKERACGPRPRRRAALTAAWTRRRLSPLRARTRTAARRSRPSVRS